MKFKRVEKYTDGGWQKTKFSNIRRGDMFRMFSEDKKPVKNPVNNTTIFRAAINTIINIENGIFELKEDEG